ncbi:MAG: hypothetical protein WA962_08445, partial [Ornithinimicrobium sp.]
MVAVIHVAVIHVAVVAVVAVVHVAVIHVAVIHVAVVAVIHVAVVRLFLVLRIAAHLWLSRAVPGVVTLVLDVTQLRCRDVEGCQQVALVSRDVQPHAGPR